MIFLCKTHIRLATDDAGSGIVNEACVGGQQHVFDCVALAGCDAASGKQTWCDGMAKAADAFRTISEVADEIGIAKHVLRFWEVKFPQVRPMKRGGGRRFYRPEDLDLLKGICQLLHNEGYTIRGVQKILRRDGVEAVKALSAAAQASTQREPPNAPRDGPPSVPPRSPKGKAALEVPVPEPVAARARGAKRTGRGQAPLPESARQAINSVLADLASLKSLLTDSSSVSEPARWRGAA